MELDLSIIIVSWNTREVLRASLQSVLSDMQTFSPQSAEIFVVDNASGDDSVAMVRAHFAQVRLIENRENVGFAAANNQGLVLAQGRYLLLLNSDTIIRPGALRTLVSFMDTHPLAGACGPRLLNADGTLQPSCHPILTPWREFWRLAFLDPLLARASYSMARWERDVPRLVEVISGACLLLRRAALDQVGLLDESYFMYTEEMDLCYRLAQAGWQAHWVPQAEVIHYGGVSSRQAARAMYVQLYRSKLQFHRKMGGPARARLFKLLVAIAYAPRLAAAALAGLWSPAWLERARTYRQLLSLLSSM